MRKFVKIGRNVLWSMMVATGLTACLDPYEREVEADGGYPTVKTQFAITVPAVNGKNSRMPADKVQQGEQATFLGLDKIWLLPFKNKLEENRNQYIHRGKLITLPGTDSYNVDGAPVNVYNDVLVPIATQQFLFYANAKQKSVGLHIGEFQQGALESTIQREMKNTEEIKFNLKPCFDGDMSDENSVWLVQASQLMAGMNGVMEQLKTWQKSPNEARRNVYANFITMRAGSGFMIRKTLQKLKQHLDEAVLQSPSGNGEASIDDIKATIYNANASSPALFNDPNLKEWKDPKLQYFPASFNIPTGAAQMQFSEEQQNFVYLNLTHTTLSDAVRIPDICYPAPLTYFARTGVAVKNVDPESVDWSSLWNGKAGFTGWANKVQLDTKVLALKEKVQYAVAGLKADFSCVEKTLPHNALDPIIVPDEGFPVTGILIGGQPNEVKWDFESDANAYDLIVYDKMVNEPVTYPPGQLDSSKPKWSSGITAKYSLESSNPNYTLLLQGKSLDNVMVMVEMVNNTKQEIYGLDKGVIPVGAHFYLLAKLAPSKKIEVTYGKDKMVVTNPSIFMKDITTEVHFKISSLKHAYLTIPDLRSTQLSVGMYVDLSWTSSRSPIRVDIGK